MQYETSVRAVGLEGELMTVALGTGSADDAIPTCPGWTVYDLAVHVGEFCGFWAHVLCEATGRPKPPFATPSRDEHVVAWLDEAIVLLVAELDATPPETPTWTWFEADRSAAFVARRCANELAVHRYDAQVALAEPVPVPVELASDGIDEVLDVLVNLRPRSGFAQGQEMVLRSADTGLEWTVRLLPDGITVDRGSEAEGAPEDSDEEHNLVITGSSSDLELTMYGRPTLDVVDLQGDASVLNQWYSEFRF